MCNGYYYKFYHFGPSLLEALGDRTGCPAIGSALGSMQFHFSLLWLKASAERPPGIWGKNPPGLELDTCPNLSVRGQLIPAREAHANDRNGKIDPSPTTPRSARRARLHRTTFRRSKQLSPESRLSSENPSWHRWWSIPPCAAHPSSPLFVPHPFPTPVHAGVAP